MSSTANDCARLIAKYRKMGHSRERAIELALDKVAHDIVFFLRNGSKSLEEMSRRRFDYLKLLLKRETT